MALFELLSRRITDQEMIVRADIVRVSKMSNLTLTLVRQGVLGDETDFLKIKYLFYPNHIGVDQKKIHQGSLPLKKEKRREKSGVPGSFEEWVASLHGSFAQPQARVLTEDNRGEHNMRNPQQIAVGNLGFLTMLLPLYEWLANSGQIRMSVLMATDFERLVQSCREEAMKAHPYIC